MTVLVEEGSVRAFEAAGLIVSFAKRISDRSEIGVSDACALRKVESLIAGEAGSGGFVPGSALITYGGADILLVKEESDGTLKTVSIAVPHLASGVDLVGECDDGAGSVDKAVALVALFADAYILIEQSALRVDFAADSVGVEVES